MGLMLGGNLSLQAQPESGEQLAATYCLACHQVDRQIVGPSFIEIARIHQGKPQDIVAWAMNPGKKRPETIQMPPMSFLGEEKLRQIADYILEVAVGRVEVVVERDAGSELASLVSSQRPKIQRIFMPDAGPAAIAVALPGDLSYCWDAGACQLRYVWKGQFIDPWPVWKGNGNALASLQGGCHFPPGYPIGPNLAQPGGLQSFLATGCFRDCRNFITSWGMCVSTNGSSRSQAMTESSRSFPLLGPLNRWISISSGCDRIAIECSHGVRDGNLLTLSPREAESFSLTTRFKP
ncbi:MAG: hypothetical protein LR011_12735 [Verrucomicrobia bacterium]|nr:hypothetical protein [Verrucomicrobiota bacterium]